MLVSGGSHAYILPQVCLHRNTRHRRPDKHDNSKSTAVRLKLISTEEKKMARRCMLEVNEKWKYIRIVHKKHLKRARLYDHIKTIIPKTSELSEETEKRTNGIPNLNVCTYTSIQK